MQRLAVLGVFFGFAAGFAQMPYPLESTEYDLKAAFLYNFTKFIQWPPKALPDTTRSIVIGILGDDPIGSALERTVLGKTVEGRGLTVRRFSSGEKPEHCHILFISASEKNRLSRILNGLADAGVLTVGDTERFAVSGGMINLVVVENRIQLEINTEAAERAGLRLSSRLLKLAKRVQTTVE